MTSSILTTTMVFLLLLTIVPKPTDADLCKWYGIGPFCFIGNSCPDGCLKTLESDKGDGMKCWVSHKNYCCCAPKLV